MIPCYQSERATLYQGDCLEVLRGLENGSVDAVVTDPPYSSGGMVRSDRTGNVAGKYALEGTNQKRAPLFVEFSGDNRDQRSFGYWCALWLGECLRLARSGAPICIFTDWRQLPVTTDALQAGGWVWRGIVPWDKTEAARPERGRFRHQCEYVVWGSKGPLPTAPTGTPCHPGLFRAAVRSADRYHLTGKPTGVMRGLVRICAPGGLVLDPFAGSASTGVAALLEGRHFLGIEQSAAYAGIARARLEATPAAETPIPAGRE